MKISFEIIPKRPFEHVVAPDLHELFDAAKGTSAEGLSKKAMTTAKRVLKEVVNNLL